MDAPDHIDVLLAQWARERPDLDTAPVAVFGRLHRVAILLTERLTALYAEFGLSEGEFDILCALRRAGEAGLAPVDVAQQTMVTTGGTTKRLHRLEERGLLARHADDMDRRRQVLTLSPAGRQLIDAAYPAHLENERQLLAPLSPSDAEALASALHRWLVALEPPRGD